jgi:hypothetical protein
MSCSICGALTLPFHAPELLAALACAARAAGLRQQMAAGADATCRPGALTLAYPRAGAAGGAGGGGGRGRAAPAPPGPPRRACGGRRAARRARRRPRARGRPRGRARAGRAAAGRAGAPSRSGWLFWLGPVLVWSGHGAGAREKGCRWRAALRLCAANDACVCCKHLLRFSRVSQLDSMRELC